MRSHLRRHERVQRHEPLLAIFLIGIWISSTPGRAAWGEGTSRESSNEKSAVEMDVCVVWDETSKNHERSGAMPSLS